MEMLDVWKNLNSQVVGLTNKQVERYQESLKPKTERDLGAEVNVDKAIENMNRTLETKLGALEFVVQNISFTNTGKEGKAELTTAPNRNVFYNSLSQVNNTGDIIPLWNSIVRSYTGIGINRETQQVIKVKIQELAPNLEAICYGITQAIDRIFSEKIIATPPFAGIILELLRTLSVYTELKAQVDSNPPRFEMFSVELLERAFKNIYNTQSNERLTLLSEYAPRGLATSATIRNIPDLRIGDFKDRINALKEELGYKLPEDRVEKLKALSGTDLDNALNEIRSRGIPAIKETISREAVERLQTAQHLQEVFEDLNERYMHNAEVGRRLEQEIAEMRDGIPIAVDGINANMRVLPELPIDPEKPDVADYVHAPPAPPKKESAKARKAREVVEATTAQRETAEFREAMRVWKKAHKQFLEDFKEYSEIRDHNDFLHDMALQTEAERQRIIDDKTRQLDELADIEVDLRDNRIPDAEEQINEFEAFQEDEVGNRNNRLYNGFIRVIFSKADKKSQGMKDSNRLEARRIELGLPRLPPAVKPKKESAKEKKERLAREEAERLAREAEGSESEEEFSESEYESNADSDIFGDLDGDGKPFKGRGRASMSNNYGYKDMIPSKKALHFDDRGNDNYYMKPAIR